MSIIILKQGGLVVVCVKAQQGQGEQRKRDLFVGVFIQGGG